MFLCAPAAVFTMCLFSLRVNVCYMFRQCLKVSLARSANVFSLRKCFVNVSLRLHGNIGALGRDLSTQFIQPTRILKDTPTSSLKK